MIVDWFELVFGSGTSSPAKIRPLKNWYLPDFLSGFANRVCVPSVRALNNAIFHGIIFCICGLFNASSGWPLQGVGDFLFEATNAALHFFPGKFLQNSRGCVPLLLGGGAGVAECE